MVQDSGISNLATSTTNKRFISGLRSQMFSAGDRLASGHKESAEIARSGRSADLYAIDRELSQLTQFEQSAAQGAIRLDAVQLALEDIRKDASQVSLAVLSSLNEQSSKSVISQAKQANGALNSIVSSLNQSAAGAALFSGASLDSAALVDSRQIVSEIEGILGAATDVSSGLVAVDFYFDDPAGGFAMNAYVGSPADGPTIEVATDQYISQGVRADHPTIKEAIRNLAIMAAVSNGAVTSPADQRAFLDDASGRSLNANEDLIELQQQMGQNQEDLQGYSVSSNARRVTLENARNDTTAVDIFEQAALFEELQVQLETSYNVLVRLSSLNLSNFLR